MDRLTLWVLLSVHLPPPKQAGAVCFEEGAEVALTVHTAVPGDGVLSRSDVLLEIFHDTPLNSLEL